MNTPGVQLPAHHPRLRSVIGLAVAAAVLMGACAPAATPSGAAPTTAPPAGATPADLPTPAPTAVPSPAGPTEFRIAIGVGVDTLDPARQTTTTVANLVDYVVETLVAIDQDGNVQPLLATSWEISDDGLEYTFSLREGVTFHDGLPLDAAAVKASLERVRDPNIRVVIRGPFTAITGIEAVDATTVKLVLGQPSAVLLPGLAMTQAGIVSPATIEAGTPGYDTIAEPVGTGPYAFAEYVEGSHVTVTRNSAYWGALPYYDTVNFQIVPEAATRESLLLAGQVDMIVLPPVADIPALEANPAVKVILAPSDRAIFISLNNNQAPLDDARVRQALNYAVDREAIVSAILFGAADVMDAPMAPSQFGYCGLGAYPYDPDKARQLLSDAGVAPGTKLSFIAPTGRYVQDFQAAEAIAGYLGAVGLEVELSTMDWPTYVGSILKPADENGVELAMLGFAAPYLDAEYQLTQLRSTSAPPNGLNTAFYDNAEVDEWAAAALAEPDAEARKGLYCRASAQVWQDAPWIFLWNQRFPIVHSAAVTNVSYYPTEKFNAVYAEPAP